MRSASTIARVRVVHGQTDRIDYGMGAFASRVTVMTGEATRLAASKVRAQGASRSRPSCCRAPPDALDIVDGEVVRNGPAPAPSISLGEIARTCRRRRRTRGGRAPGSPPKAGSTPTT